MTEGPSSAGIHARPISSAVVSRGTHRAAESLDVDVIDSSRVSASEQRSRRGVSGDGADPARGRETGQIGDPARARVARPPRGRGARRGARASRSTPGPAAPELAAGAAPAKRKGKKGRRSGG